MIQYQQPEDAVLQLVDLASLDQLDSVPSLTFRRAGEIVPHKAHGVFSGFSTMPVPAWDVLPLDRYTLPIEGEPYLLVETSRGCPYTCDFCAERRLNGGYGYRDRPAEEIVEEIRQSGGKHIFFAASQFVGYPRRTMELLEALIPLKIRWSALFSPRFGLDAKFLDLAKRSGLLHVNMGIGALALIASSLVGIAVAEIVRRITKRISAKKPSTTPEDTPEGISGEFTLKPLVTGYYGDTLSAISRNVYHNLCRMRDLHPCSKVRITYTVEAID